jgi:hypothetical protein
MKRRVTCDYCRRPAEFLPSSAPVYGRDYGPVWRCEPCGAWVGCHKGSDTPLGRLANKSLRAMKIRAHDAFDPIWRGTKTKRGSAYAWLADQMGLDRKDCHIGMFNEDQCQLVVIVSDWWRERSASA